MSGEQYDSDYFLRGKETGKSLYTDYRWLPDLTIPMTLAIVDHLGIEQKETVLDFGCARGYTVRALRELGHSAYGYDVSEWAIANADESVRHFVTRDRYTLDRSKYDWVIAKDVLEHVEDVYDVTAQLMDHATKGVFAVVPLSNCDGSKYVVREYEEDVTHIHRLTLQTWAGMFMRPGWSVEARYRLRGVKDNYAIHAKGNGFIVARRI